MKLFLNHCFTLIRLGIVAVAVHMMHWNNVNTTASINAWVADIDIKGFFDNISHEWMMKMVRHHTQQKWVLLYIERWLKAGV